MSEQKKWDYRVVRTNKEDGTPNMTQYPEDPNLTV